MILKTKFINITLFITTTLILILILSSCQTKSNKNVSSSKQSSNTVVSTNTIENGNNAEKDNDEKNISDTNQNSMAALKSTTGSNDNIAEGSQDKVISEGKNYKVLDIGANDERKYEFYIYDLNHKVVKKDTIERMAPSITYIDNTTLEIRFFGGTSAIQCQYYDIGNNKFSKQFENPNLVQNGLIVYMQGINNNIKLIVQNIFDSKLFYKEYKRDFSPTGLSDMDLESAKFLDKDHLQITYFIKSDFREQEEVIDLKK